MKQIVQPCTVFGDCRQLVQFIEDRSSPVWKGYLFSIALFLSMQLQSIFFHQLWHQSTSLGLRIRTSLISAVFRKVEYCSSLGPCFCTSLISAVFRKVNCCSPLICVFAPVSSLLSSEKWSVVLPQSVFLHQSHLCCLQKGQVLFVLSSICVFAPVSSLLSSER